MPVCSTTCVVWYLLSWHPMRIGIKNLTPILVAPVGGDLFVERNVRTAWKLRRSGLFILSNQTNIFHHIWFHISLKNLNVNLRIGIRHNAGRSYGAFFSFCIDSYKQVAPTGAIWFFDVPLDFLKNVSIECFEKLSPVKGVLFVAFNR